MMTGTFTKPMPIGEGKTIPPTGKRFAIDMANHYDLCRTHISSPKMKYALAHIREPLPF